MPSCRVAKLPSRNVPSCRPVSERAINAGLPSTPNVHLPSCQVVELPSCQTVELQYAKLTACNVTICKLPSC